MVIVKICFNYLIIICYIAFLQIGINCESDRAAIMLAVENYLAEVKLNDSTSPVTASAPLEEPSTSNQDNTIQNVNITNECIICFDSNVNMFYIYRISMLDINEIIIISYCLSFCSAR